MYRERKKKWRTIKLVITEIIMIIAVIVIVILLTFFAMGYRVDKDGEVGQQGLIQIQSYPTGATIMIDEETLLSHTNTSKLLSAGSHKITLKKDGYDTWTKMVTSEVGRLIKLTYPRLFLKERTPEKMREYEHAISFFAPAANHDAVLYSVDNNKKWVFLDVRGDDAVEQELDLSDLMAELIFEDVVWNENSDKVLVKARHDDNIEWLLVSVSNPSNAINLNKEFDMNFSELEFMNDGGDKLIAIQDGTKLRTINMSSKTISGVLATGVKSFTYNDERIFYLNDKNELRTLKDSTETLVSSYKKEQKINVVAFGYLDNKYLAIFVDNKCYIYAGDYPDSTHNLVDMSLKFEKEIEFVPDMVSEAAYGELVMARSERNMAVFDAELDKMSEFNLAGDQMFFIDKYLIGTISDGKLVVADFDGTNVRTLTTANGTAFITKNNKWLYYINTIDNKTNIYREKIMD